MSPKFISMRQFSKLAGVSLATTSRVFSNPETVAEDTVKRVLSLAEEVGFSPNQVAKAAFGASTKSVGVILATLSDSYFGGIVRAIQNELIRAGYLPIFIESSESSELPEESLKRLLNHKVDALIIGFSDENLNIPKVCMNQITRLPIVVIEQIRDGVWSDFVVNDDYDGGFQAGKHLTELGHRRFGACTYGGSRSNCVPRINGFRDAIRQAGGILDERFTAHYTDQENKQEVFRADLSGMLSSPDRPGAFFATTDYLALHLYHVAKQVGLRIPEDLSVVGFGNLQFSEYVCPPLTTIVQNPGEIGRKAAELLLKRLEDPERPVKEIRVPVKLLVRESTTKEKQI